MKKRILSLLLTLVMVISLIPTTAWAADNTVTVTFSAQKDGAFLFTPQTVTVEDGIAETYGFEIPDSVTGPTVLDLMVAAHKKLYGDAFTTTTVSTYLTLSGTGMLQTVFKEASGGNVSFTVNHQMPSVGAASAALSNNDIVDFWFYWEPSTYLYGDHFTYFADSTKSVATGATFDLTLTGFPAMSAMGSTPTSTPIDETDEVEGTYLTINTVNTDGNLSDALTDASGDAITPDADGKVTLSFNTAGTYIVTANGFVSGNPAIAPWCIVTVTGGATGGGSDTPPASTTKTLDSLKFYKADNDTSLLTLSPTFASSTNTYDLSVLDQDGPNLYVAATPTDEGDSVTAAWTKLNDSSAGSIAVSATGRTSLLYCIKQGTVGNTVRLTVGADTDPAYTINVKRAPTLTALSIDSLTLNDTFAYNVTSYTAETTADSVTLSATAYQEGYTITYNDSTSPTVTLTGDVTPVKVKVTDPTSSLSTEYTINITRTALSTVDFSTTPANASVVVYDSANDLVEPGTDGKYQLLNSSAYSYAVTCKGYVSKYVASYTPTGNTTIDVTLTAAPTSTRTDVGAAWKNFRNSDVNMGFTDAKTPIADAVLKWNKKLGTGWEAAPSVSIIVDNSLIVMSGSKLYKLDLSNGDITAQSTMCTSTGYGTISPTYAEGLILCTLSNGTIQAFNAKTLESVWIYRNPLKGQALSPITYSDGYIYTGFWIGETSNANYVCLSLTDEDPTKTDEAKYATWSKTVPGGFYWAGSVAVGDFLIFGSDDGASGTTGTSYLYALNKTTGKEISKLALTGLGDQRSSIAYDSTGKRVYFTTKGGYLCSAAVAANGTLSDLRSNKFSSQSTSTPIVYKDYVYVCGGSGVVEGSGGKGNFFICKASDLSVVKAVATPGYPQCSPLLSTAYESSGYLYFYCTYNAKPGGISLIKVKTSDQTATHEDLFTPETSMQNYCLTSIICGTDGTLYYKNDSGNVFAVSDNATIAAAVTAKIDDIGEVTLASESKINAARTAYDALTAAQKALVTSYNTLTTAEAKLADLKAADAAKDKIDAIGTVTLDSEAKIVAARSAYDALTDAQKELVTNYNTLTTAETTLADLKATADRAAANAVIGKINAVTTAIEGGDTDAIKSAIADAKAAYNSLTDAQKTLVTNYDVLTAADSKYNPTGSKHEHTRRQPSTTGTASGTTTNTKDDVKSPATGDSSHMLLSLSGTLFSAAAIAVLTTKKKRSAR